MGRGLRHSALPLHQSLTAFSYGRSFYRPPCPADAFSLGCGRSTTTRTRTMTVRYPIYLLTVGMRAGRVLEQTLPAAACQPSWTTHAMSDQWLRRGDTTFDLESTTVDYSPTTNFRVRPKAASGDHSTTDVSRGKSGTLIVRDATGDSERSILGVGQRDFPLWLAEMWLSRHAA